nr:phosphoribosylformylglycinamidine synthase subunit PurL [Ignavibacteria bacterium]
LETPVTGGNVSFYNQSKDYAVFPTPSIGMIGLLEDYEKMVTSNFKNEGDTIVLLGNNSNNGIDGSEYLNTIHNLIKGDAPEINLNEEKKLIDTLIQAADKKLLKSAHDISDGGLAVALAECCIIDRNNRMGCKINFDYNSRKDFALFNESQGRAIVSIEKNNLDSLSSLCKKHKLDYIVIGETTLTEFVLNQEVRLTPEVLSNAYFNSLEKIMQ